MNFKNIILSNSKVKEFLQKVKNDEKDMRISGLTHSRLPFFLSGIYSELNKNIVLITYDKAAANKIYEDLIRSLGNEIIVNFPDYEVLPHEQIESEISVVSERVSVFGKLFFENESGIIITYGQALVRRLVPPGYLEKYYIRLYKGQSIELQNITKKLISAGYKRVDMVDSMQQFSVRGGIVDVFPCTADKPYRVDFFGDQIESIKFFDLNTQRSQKEVNEIIIPPSYEFIVSESILEEKIPIIKKKYDQAIKKLKERNKGEEGDYLKEKSSELIEKIETQEYFPGHEQYFPIYFNKLFFLFDYFNKNRLILFDQPSKVWNRIENYCRDIYETQESLLEQGSILPGYDKNFWSADKIRERCASERIIEFVDYSEPEEEDFVFYTQGIEPYHGQMKMFAKRLEKLVKENRIIVTLNSKEKAERIFDYLQEMNLPVVKETSFPRKGQILIMADSFSEGFLIEDFNLAVFTEKEVLGNPQKKKRKMVDLHEGIDISSFEELKSGDFVVHENHGIGKYMGIETLEIQNSYKDYLVIKYKGEDKLYVPTEQVNLIQKYIGSDSAKPKLYKLGGNEWQKAKEKVKDSVKEMAIGLLELYAERETIDGYAFSPDTVWQKEFEESFPYEETPDQFKAIEDVKNDMESNKPMDRLLCGDVGYGKTEVAIRAAFKAAVDEKQTAVLVPTTILAQQHYNTFSERVSEFPIKVEMVSRFKTRSEQKDILKKLSEGKIDIIIGTHRLFSRDVKFNNLGLLIIDEEQRFGVSHKEKLKDMKKNVDVLTLTATPIPRTLHMALVGVRDMSVIETPPENRFPIRTYIREYSRELIQDAVRREMSRGGQIYFVHNRVEDIDKKARMIKKLLPEARIAVAHGQMNEKRLERLMLDFYDYKYDILICTTIIESGLDIPNVNTIIINRAENMGLAQLYQLRGRVGRTNKIAYAYLLYKKNRVLPEVAEKRLRAIKEFTNLGSGFKIAMRDLEIRGAGNLLGAEQHGHIASVGFSLYCKLLEQAVNDLKDKEEDNYEIDVDIELSVSAYIPDDYIESSRQKVAIYKKIKNANTFDNLEDIEDELNDRFGVIPEKVVNLLYIREIAIRADALGISKIKEEKNVVNCYFDDVNNFPGNKVIKLSDKYPGCIKIKAGTKPVLGINIINQEGLEFVEKVLEEFQILVSSN